MVEQTGNTMKGECPYCGRMYDEQHDGYFYCKVCQKPYLPLNVHKKRTEQTQKFLDYEEQYGKN